MAGFKTTALFALLAASIAAHHPAHAGIIVTTETNPSQTFVAAAGDDLINSGAATLAGETHTGFTPFEFQGGLSNTAALNDGLIGAAWSNPSDALKDTAFDLDGVWTSTYELNLGLARIGRRRFGIFGKRLGAPRGMGGQTARTTQHASLEFSNAL